MVHALSTTGYAFVVFRTEQERDTAVERVNAQGGIECDNGFRAFLKAEDAEPATVEWQNFNASWEEFHGWRDTVRRYTVAIGEIVVALLLWVLVFYTPYVYFILGFSYQNGTQPGWGIEISLTLVVALGNQVMYVVCYDAASRLRLHFTDDTQVAYLIMFFLACLVNVVADLVVTFNIAYTMQVAAGLRTYNGILLSEVETFTEVFQVYSMQRELGNQLFSYAFPSTFLLPFILEPIATIVLPYWFMNRLVRTHPECSDTMVEQALVCTDMDLSRYADILLNLGIAVLTFCFPGGFTAPTFLALAFSHMYIFAYDHYRVLRGIKVCEFVNFSVERTTQLLLSIPCGMLLSILVLEFNCDTELPHALSFCAEGPTLIARLVQAFLAHVVVHVLCVLLLVPRFKRKDHTTTAVPYEQTASVMPRSWFSLSRTYCLRSQHFYRHDPPCRHYVPGKEYLMQENPEACCFYSTTSDAKGAA